MQLLTAALALMAGAAEAKAPISGNNKYANSPVEYEVEKFDETFAPKAVVVSLFQPEAEIWHKYQNFTHNITLPGLSPLFPNVSCTNNYDLCQVTTGEGEINAASSITALLTSAKFNFTETYFLVAGIAGLNPYYGGLGSAAFARYTVSVALQYEVDAREMPKNWTTGYWSYGTTQPGKAPGNYYGTEVFEVNEKLRDYAAALASNVTLLSNTTGAMRTNNLYNISTARGGAKVLKCDSATSDVYYTGNLLSETFANTTKLFTNGTGRYCTTSQEDSAVMEAAVRAAKFGLTDFSRWVLLRTASDYDRPPVQLANNTVGFFNYNNTGGFEIAIENIYRAGSPFIKAVLGKWNSTFINATYLVNSTINGTKNGTGHNGTLAPQNYIGDVFGTLGDEPDFGPGSYKDIAYI